MVMLNMSVEVDLLITIDPDLNHHFSPKIEKY